ncbi:MAG: DNA polymerase III subunit delta [Clostridia bacterium]|nr:DNA polymerase III subunit delta [Clostridia bacterium]
MDILKEADFRKELKATPRTGYLFFGDEDYLKSFAVKQAREVLCPDPSFAFFNEMKLDAVDFEPQKLLDALMPMPMMADRKLITLTGLNFTTMRQNELDALCDVLALLPEYDYNLLIVTASADCLNAGYLPKSPSAVLKRLGEFLTPVQFDRCTTAKLAAWVQKHFAHNGADASAELCSLLPEYCGHSMFILANEIDKLAYYVLSHGRNTVTEEDMRLVCTPANEYDAFAFTNAIMEGRQEAALSILSDYRFRRIEPTVILGEVSRVICDMIAVRAMSDEGTPGSEIAAALGIKSDFKIKLYQRCLRNTTEARMHNALEACLDADRLLKLSPQGYAPLEKLVCQI